MPEGPSLRGAHHGFIFTSQTYGLSMYIQIFEGIFQRGHFQTLWTESFLGGYDAHPGG
jgi:hypothetical protein